MVWLNDDRLSLCYISESTRRPFFPGTFTRNELIILTLGLALIAVLLLVFLIVACILIFVLIKRRKQRNRPQILDTHDAENASLRACPRRALRRHSNRITPMPNDDEIRNLRHDRESAMYSTVATSTTSIQHHDERPPPYYSMQKPRPIWMP